MAADDSSSSDSGSGGASQDQIDAAVALLGVGSGTAKAKDDTVNIDEHFKQLAAQQETRFQQQLQEIDRRNQQSNNNAALRASTQVQLQGMRDSNKNNNGQLQEKTREFDKTFGLTQNEFNLKEEQAYQKQAQNPFDMLNYMAYLGGVTSSPIGPNPIWDGYVNSVAGQARGNEMPTLGAGSTAPGSPPGQRTPVGSGAAAGVPSSPNQREDRQNGQESGMGGDQLGGGGMGIPGQSVTPQVSPPIATVHVGPDGTPFVNPIDMSGVTPDNPAGPAPGGDQIGPWNPSDPNIRPFRAPGNSFP